RVVAALPAVLDAVDRSVAEARVQLAAREAERAEQNEQLAKLRRDEADLRARLAAVSESVQGLEMQIYEKKLHASALVERASEELGLVEDVLIAEYGPHVPVPDDPTDAPTPDAAPDAPTPDAAPADAASAPPAEPMSEMQESTDADPENPGEASTENAPTPAFVTGVAFVRAEQEARLAKFERKLAQL